ncbi:hypothetical protein PR048_013988 [Dryococelus australis]|uniref:DUF4371 domain-containing protein n=1 Tax=Dryococelus australis TaxID=614101 RepID=A0ABQ9HUN7_9NEOP|nr:hypothetical protein PR048_013988 [Dryococelus australis]
MRYFSVLADETTNIAHDEQCLLCMHYVDEEMTKLREDFLTFVQVYDVIGLGLANIIQVALKDLGFDLNKMCGQIQNIGNAFGTLSEICTFLHSSAQQTENLKSCIIELKPGSHGTKLKTLCETCWILHHGAVFIFK